jgi:3-hydroxyacyl-[acyl-carrier-protein] dehydratase
MKIDIQKRLHHRPPYLLIDEVVEATPTGIHVRATPRGEEFYLRGHFPGSPVVPGAMMQEMTTQAAGLLISEFHAPVPDYDSETTKGHALGVLRAVHYAKYRKFARPGDVLDVRAELLLNVDSSFRFKAWITVAGEKIMANEFTLVNVTEAQLRGAEAERP